MFFGMSNSLLILLPIIGQLIRLAMLQERARCISIFAKSQSVKAIMTLSQKSQQTTGALVQSPSLPTEDVPWLHPGHICATVSKLLLLHYAPVWRVSKIPPELLHHTEGRCSFSLKIHTLQDINSYKDNTAYIAISAHNVAIVEVLASLTW